MASRVFELVDDELLDYEGRLLYSNGTFEFEEGITVLVGCNGSGKTTLMKTLRNKLADMDIPTKTMYALDGKGEISYRMLAARRILQVCVLIVRNGSVERLGAFIVSGVVQGFRPRVGQGPAPFRRV